MPSNSKFTKNSNGDTSVRVVSSTQGVADTDQDSVFCKDSSGNTAIRVVTAQESLPAEQPDSMFTKDTHGNTAIRTVGGGGGSAPVIDELNVTPSTSAQTITAPSGVDGYSPVNVAAVTSAIDANITAGNIKKDVEILGVRGNYEGQVPTGTKSITANGVYDVTDFASADVQVPTTAPALYREFQLDANGVLQPNTTTTHIMDFTGMTDVSIYALTRAYYGNAAISGAVDMGDLTKISGANACSDMFSGCTGLTSIDLSALTTISGANACSSMFSGCTGLTSIDLSALTTISKSNACSSMFSGCSGLTSVNLNGLNVVAQQISSSYTQVFSNCTHLESVTLGGLTASTFASKKDQIAYLFSTTTGNAAPNGCTVHFPSNFDPSDPNHTFDASTLTGYPTFGGNASYIHVAFDLPATE